MVSADVSIDSATQLPRPERTFRYVHACLAKSGRTGRTPRLGQLSFVKTVQAQSAGRLSATIRPCPGACQRSVLRATEVVGHVRVNNAWGSGTRLRSDIVSAPGRVTFPVSGKLSAQLGDKERKKGHGSLRQGLCSSSSSSWVFGRRMEETCQCVSWRMSSAVFQRKASRQLTMSYGIAAETWPLDKPARKLACESSADDGVDDALAYSRTMSQVRPKPCLVTRRTTRCRARIGAA